MTPHYKHGLVIGKFWPPHLGHELLWRHAATHCGQVTILVEQRPQEDVNVDVRTRWAQHTMSDCPHVTIKPLYGDHPQEPSHHPDFWNYWGNLLKKHAHEVDAVIANEPYGDNVAKSLGAVWLHCDMKRTTHPISGTRVRSNPWAEWAFLQPSVRQASARRIVLLGAESTGKSVLARHLAQTFETSWVPEWAETAIMLGAKPDSHEVFDGFAAHQKRLRLAAAKEANRVVFEDSCALTTAVFEEAILGKCRPKMWRKAFEDKPHAIILCAPEGAPFVDAPHRKISLSREEMHGRFVECLNDWGWPYIEVAGSYADRSIQAEVATTSWVNQWSQQSWRSWVEMGVADLGPTVVPHPAYRPGPSP